MSLSSKIEVNQLRIYLRRISPIIWRRVLVRGDSTIADLHYTLQIAMGWTDSHLNRFVIRGKEYGVAHIGGMSFTDDPREVRLADFNFRPLERFLYEYDFRDKWQHEIRLEERGHLDLQRTYPVCIGGSRYVPPEDCGGPRGFLTLESHYSIPYMANRMLEIIEDDHPRDHRAEVGELMYWLSVNKFDRRAVNKRLRQFAVGDQRWREVTK
jgi:hypothetical protein